MAEPLSSIACFNRRVTPKNAVPAIVFNLLPLAVAIFMIIRGQNLRHSLIEKEVVQGQMLLGAGIFFSLTSVGMAVFSLYPLCGPCDDVRYYIADPAAPEPPPPAPPLLGGVVPLTGTPHTMNTPPATQNQ